MSDFERTLKQHLVSYRIVSHSRGEHPQNIPHFQLRHLVVVPSSGVDTKLNIGAQLQTFLYPLIPKPLLSVKSFSQTLRFKNVTN